MTLKNNMHFMYQIASPNNALQLTSNTPLRSVLRSTELKRYVLKTIKFAIYPVINYDNSI